MKQVVRTFLKNNDWKYLLVKHVWKDMWILPWGHIETNETIYKAIKREIKEELNLDIKLLGNKLWIEIDWIKEKTQPVCTYKIEFNSKKYWKIKKIEYIFLSKIKKWEIKIQEDEISEYNFFTKDEIINLNNIYNHFKEILIKIEE
jgi:NADH pyrophosphatase NudC (nudix superfamily)